eukprot:10686347-Karenia_brevis.AAC.1
MERQEGKESMVTPHQSKKLLNLNPGKSFQSRACANRVVGASHSLGVARRVVRGTADIRTWQERT